MHVAVTVRRQRLHVAATKVTKVHVAATKVTKVHVAATKVS